MKMNKKWGLLLLALYLILVGLTGFIPALAGLGVVWNILAIVAGILIAIDM